MKICEKEWKFIYDKQGIKDLLRMAGYDLPKEDSKLSSISISINEDDRLVIKVVEYIHYSPPSERIERGVKEE